jgi:hypothetical protein
MSCTFGILREYDLCRPPAPERTPRLAETMMSNPHLPAEILDHIIDHLHDTEDTLRNCSLVSKSWIPRTRKHLFANIVFPNVETLQSWKETFPDPSTSPAGYTKTLFIDCPQVSTAGSWIRDFSRVEHFGVGAHIDALVFDLNESPTPLVLFHGFSPALKTLDVIVRALPSSQIFNLVLSFPLLEDLMVIVHREMLLDQEDDSEEDGISSVTRPSSPPRLTGSLRLHLERMMEPFTRRLLSIPSGIHFQNLTLTLLCEDDFLTTMALVEVCSHTLESLDITCRLRGKSVRHLCSRKQLMFASR